MLTFLLLLLLLLLLFGRFVNFYNRLGINGCFAEEEDSGGGEGCAFGVKASSSASAPAAPSLHTLVLLDRVEGVDAGVGLTHVNRRKNASISCPTQRLVSMQSAASGCE
jgi:hypothetical protein